MTTTQQPQKRDYNTISPSAKSLVLLKGVTNIPFARQTAELMAAPKSYHINSKNKDLAYWKRVVHFEVRYWSVDQLLSALTITNILELSSGYSFRGLAMVRENNVCYVDTDLPEVIAKKKQLLPGLQKDQQDIGTLKTIPLNALDAAQFAKVSASFPKGPVIIVNEGLLMYLDTNEKKMLCGIIRQVLKERGGYWITADVYVKSTLERFNQQEDDSLKDLVETQRIEENMFESFDEAEEFFKAAGFSIVKEAVADFAKISSLHHLINNATETELAGMQASSEKIQATWCLQVNS